MAAAADAGDEKAMARMIFEMLQKMQRMEGFEASEEESREMSKTLESLAASIEGDEAARPADTPRSAAPPDAASELVPVSPRFECPEGTRERGAAPPHGFERWCERPGLAGGWDRHGGYAMWHRNARIHETGSYLDGEREGVWTRWNARAKLETQAEFHDGRQHGFQIDWDELGQKRREVRFARGEPVGG